MLKVNVVTFNGDHLDSNAYSGRKYWYDSTDRFRLFPNIINPLNPQIVCLQELFGGNDAEVGETLRTLARWTGMCCEVNGKVAAAKSRHHNLGTGFLWDPDLEVVNYSADRAFWHPLSRLDVNLRGKRAIYYTHHAQPVGKVQEYGDMRTGEAERLVRLMRKHRFAVLAKDCNGLPAVRDAYGEYLDIAPDRALLAKTMTPTEQEFVLSRRPAEVLQEGGLVDLAVYPHLRRGHWRYTTDHRPTREGGQRLDRFYLTPALARQVTDWSVVRTALTLRASDHLPVVLNYRLP